ncbi:MAG: gliding motility-associated C-terminal domain-containing protein, partial [Bacteroidota bacterium]
SIYNRWGQLLFSTQNPIYGWNGSNPNGSKAPQDNYIYNIQFKDLEGRAYNKNGSVLLLSVEKE